MTEPRSSIESALAAFAGAIRQEELNLDGDILFELTGAGGGSYCIQCSKEGVQLDAEPRKGRPCTRITGDADTILAILGGEADARERFAAGAFRVRGDLSIAGTVAAQLGIYRDPMQGG